MVALSPWLVPLVGFPGGHRLAVQATATVRLLFVPTGWLRHAVVAASPSAFGNRDTCCAAVSVAHHQYRRRAFVVGHAVLYSTTYLGADGGEFIHLSSCVRGTPLGPRPWLCRCIRLFGGGCAGRSQLFTRTRLEEPGEEAMRWLRTEPLTVTLTSSSKAEAKFSTE